MCDYTSEEIQEVYRKQREYEVNRGRKAVSKAIPSRLEILAQVYKEITEASKQLHPNNWGTNERA